MKYLDTNVFARVLVEAETPDQFRMQRQAQALLLSVEAGDVEITTTEAVLHELFYVLTSLRPRSSGRSNALFAHMVVPWLSNAESQDRRTSD